MFYHFLSLWHDSRNQLSKAVHRQEIWLLVIWVSRNRTQLLFIMSEENAHVVFLSLLFLLNGKNSFEWDAARVGPISEWHFVMSAIVVWSSFVEIYCV